MPTTVPADGTVVRHDRLFIGGSWRTPSTSRLLRVHSPATEALVGVVPEAGSDDVDAAVRAARAAFDTGPWPRLDVRERAGFLRRLAALFAEREDDLARTLTAEAGLPLATLSAPTVGAAITAFNVAADFAESHEWEVVRQGVYLPFLVRKEPVGVVGTILPWNSPIALTMNKLAPALLAGCTVVHKPAPETPLHAFVLAEIFEAAGLPAGVVNIVPGGRDVGEAVVRHPGVDKISFTGSTGAGKRIAALCGEQVKRVSLELGGKSASILLEDVDIATQIPAVVNAGMMNNGEACVNQTRVLTPRSRYAEVVDALTAAVAARRVGDPFDPAVDMGPLIARRQRERVEGLIASALAEGGRIVQGGGRPAGLSTGWFVEPTVITEVENGMRIAREEIFGPVLTVIGYDGSLDEAVAIANDSSYGLSGSVWTADPEAGLEVARRVRAGHFGINIWLMDPLQPFGGFKESGLGRENGLEGLDEFLETKSINYPPGWQPAPGS